MILKRLAALFGCWVAGCVFWLAQEAGANPPPLPGPLLHRMEARGQEGDVGRIAVNAGQVSHRLSRYLTGACIEDVNHEIYGGLYSQMVFGESFQEPAPLPGLDGFGTCGGRWQAKEGVLWAEGGDGPKLISDELTPAEGEVGVEVFLPGQKNGNAGLILNVNDPGPGADRLDGYEIALDAAGHLIFGRHRQNWEPIRNVGCEVPADRWVDLVVRVAGRSREVLVNGKSVLTYEDREHPLSGGRVGLRTWQREARFRNLYVVSGEQKRPLRFEAKTNSIGGEVSERWRGFRRGTAQGGFALETKMPFIGHQSQRLIFSAGEGELGIENQSLNRWGMNLVAGRRYEGYFWARAEAPTEVWLALESADRSKCYAEKRIQAKAGAWKRIEFRLEPSATDRCGRLAIKLKRPGSICIGHVFLEPGDWGRFKGLPVRKDVSEGLIAQGLTVLRYGGSMVNDPEYRWKNMIGPRDRRPPYRGTWYPYSSNGWAIFDFLNFCEAAGFLGIPAVDVNESPQDMADFVEYANGPSGSEWGKRRVADGHRASYGLKYLELGNEEAVDEAYWQKFKPLAESIWAKDPDIILIVGDFAYDKAIEDPYHFSGAPRIQTLAAHKKILDLAREHGREVWFDVHIGTEQPPAPHGLPGVRSFMEQLGRISPGAKYKVAVFEFNAGNHAMKRALANACAINQLERLGDGISVACSANCLQPYQQNDNGWNQGLLFLSSSQVWPQPPYFVTQMVARDFLPVCVNAEVRSPGDALDVTATRDEAGNALVLQVVNVSGQAVTAALTLERFVPRHATARRTVLAGDWNGINTPEEPERIRPVEERWTHGLKGGVTSCSFPAHSFSIIRFE